jgi:hypothetical protein
MQKFFQLSSPFELAFAQNGCRGVDSGCALRSCDRTHSLLPVSRLPRHCLFGKTNIPLQFIYEMHALNISLNHNYLLQDKTMKVWDISGDKPEFVFEKNAKLGVLQVKKVMTVSQCCGSALVSMRIRIH